MSEVITITENTVEKHETRMQKMAYSYVLWASLWELDLPSSSMSFKVYVL